MINKLKIALLQDDLEAFERAANADISTLSAAELEQVQALINQAAARVAQLRKSDLERLHALERAAAYAKEL